MDACERDVDRVEGLRKTLREDLSAQVVAVAEFDETSRPGREPLQTRAQGI